MSQNVLPSAGGMVFPVKIFLSSSLITMQNLAACHKVWGMLTRDTTPFLFM